MVERITSHNNIHDKQNVIFIETVQIGRKVEKDMSGFGIQEEITFGMLQTKSGKTLKTV
jgi:hypothetical protein